jgi:hypothetical protein
MGYIPLFLTVGGACFLFFMTVRISLNRKVELDRQLWEKLLLLYPDSERIKKASSPDQLLETWKNPDSNEKATSESLELLRQIKVNRFQYNQLIKKAPYNWVAVLGGFKPM